MKNTFKILGIIAIVAMMVTVSSCATGGTIGGASGGYGFFTGNGSANTLIDGATEIASYSVILGLFDSGYGEYVTAVKAAEASGKKIVSVSKNFFGFMVKTTAYAK